MGYCLVCNKATKRKAYKYCSNKGRGRSWRIKYLKSKI